MSLKIGTNRDDQISGTKGNDIVIARAGDDVISTGAGNDLIDAGRGNDAIDGGKGNDAILAGAGDDIIDGGEGNDLIMAGAGDDVVVHVAAENVDGIDIYDGGNDVDTLRLVLTEDEWGRADIKTDVKAYLEFLGTVINSSGVAKGKPFHFESLGLIVTRFEKLEVFVDGQRLTVVVADPHAPPVTVDLGQSTNDERVEILGDGDTIISTGSGDDVIVVGNGTNVIDAGDGQNQITTGSGDDVITAGDGGNVIDAGNGNNQITTGDGPDVIVVGSGDDIISSNGGDDHITIGDGDDIVNAGPGDDTIVAGEGGGDDVIDGFSGTDTVTYPSSTQDLAIDLRPTDRSATSTAGGGTVGDLLTNAGYDPNLAVGLAWGADIGTDVLISIENATGGAGNDTFIGSTADNTFDGAAGNDQVIYEGSVLGYDITIGAGISTVTDTDLANGDTGQDKLSAIEQAVFSDVTVMLDGRNNDPFTVPDTLSTTEDDAVTFAGSVLLANDREFDGDGMTVTSLDTSGTLGAAFLNPDGTITYDPNGVFDRLASGEAAIDAIVYTVDDGIGGIATGTATITVNGINDAPVLHGTALDALSYRENSSAISIINSFSVDGAFPIGATGTEDFIVTALSGDRFVASWSDGSDLVGQVFDVNGEPVGAEFTVSGGGSFGAPSVARLPPSPTGGRTSLLRGVKALTFADRYSTPLALR